MTISIPLPSFTIVIVPASVLSLLSEIDISIYDTGIEFAIPSLHDLSILITWSLQFTTPSSNSLKSPGI